MNRILIKNAKVVDPAHQFEGQRDLYIENGFIIEPSTDFQADKVIDATGLTVCPGLIDLSARLREPGYEHKATLESELLSAVAGGVTSVVCPPDTDPPLDEPGLVEMLTHRAKSVDLARVFPLGALTQKLQGKTLTEMLELTEAGCIGFSHADANLYDTQVLYRAMQYASTYGFTVWLRPQDPYLSREGVAHQGEIATRLGLVGIPTSAETIAIQTILRLIQDTGAKVHFCRVSSAEGIELIRQAKKEGLSVTADAGIYYTHLSEVDINFFDTNCRLSPPLRTIDDKLAIRKGILDGTIDAICSDHAPVDDDAKILPFGEAEVGATGLELLLPLTLQWGKEEKLSLIETLQKITLNPAKILNQDKKIGHLSIGAKADICIFDENAIWKVEAKSLKSQGKNTPYYGKLITGKVCYSIVGGKEVYNG